MRRSSDKGRRRRGSAAACRRLSTRPSHKMAAIKARHAAVPVLTAILIGVVPHWEVRPPTGGCHCTAAELHGAPLVPTACCSPLLPQPASISSPGHLQVLPAKPLLLGLLLFPALVVILIVAAVWSVNVDADSNFNWAEVRLGSCRRGVPRAERAQQSRQRT